jgi:cytochrome P450
VPVDGNTVLAESDVLPGGHVVSRGTEVLYSAYVMHRLPELWPEPETFNPDRCSDICTSVFPSSFPPTLFIDWCATSSRRAHELAPECGYFLHTRVCVREPRFLTPPKPFTYMPFHGGPRLCLGMDMAYLETKVRRRVGMVPPDPPEATRLVYVLTVEVEKWKPWNHPALCHPHKHTHSLRKAP